MRRCLLAVALVLILAASLIPASACTSPASFQLGVLAVSPQIVMEGDSVTISANVTNDGGSAGIFEALLSLDGAEVEEGSKHLSLIDISRLSKLGADGGVATFPIGFSEESEYRGFKEIADTSHKARRAGIPLLADTHFGREITDKNRLEAADLAAMMSTEAGADGVFVPCEEGQEQELWEKLQYAQI